MNRKQNMEPDYFAKQVLSAKRFYLSLTPSSGRRARVVSGGWESCTPQYDLRRQGLPFLTLELAVKGAGEIILNGHKQCLTPATACIYGPGVPHRIKADPVKGMTKYFIAVTGAEALEWLDQAGLSLSSTFPVRGLAELQHLFETMIATGRGDSNARARICNATFQHLLMRLGELSMPNATEGMTSLGTYRRCRAFIEENYLRLQSVQELARECRVAPEYLCRLFRKFRRQTPFQYLQSLKMNRAVELLKEGQSSVKQVADQVGYTDPYHFSRAFKRHYGLPPVKLLPSASRDF